MTEPSSIRRIAGPHRGRSRAVIHGGLVWTVATSPGASVAEQTAGCLATIDAALREAGTDRSRIVEAVVYLPDISRKSEMDEVWCEWIPDNGWPCRACVSASLPTGDLVEIKLTAALP